MKTVLILLYATTVGKMIDDLIERDQQTICCHILNTSVEQLDYYMYIYLKCL